MPTIDTRWSHLSHSAIILENRRLRIVVLPELGGRIWSIVYKPLDREVLWHNPRINPQKVPFGAGFDDVWCGGWEEMFPTAAPGEINGERFPDHGEIWSLPWATSQEATADSASLRLRCKTPISGVSVEKCLLLVGDEAKLHVAYTIENLGSIELPFIFAMHPAMAVSEGYRIDFPPMSVDLEPSYPGTLTGAPASFLWPLAPRDSTSADLRSVCSPSSREVYFLYGHGYQEGWCAITDQARRFTAGFTFSPEVFRSCWIFATYGGWRGYQVALLEPCTSRPQQIEAAVEQGRAARLPPGGTWSTAVTFAAQEGLSLVGGLASDGMFREEQGAQNCNREPVAGTDCKTS